VCVIKKRPFSLIVPLSTSIHSLPSIIQEAAQRRDQKKLEKKQMKMKQIKVKAM